MGQFDRLFSTCSWARSTPSARTLSACALGALALLKPASSFALGNVRFETSGFLRPSDSRSQTSSTLIIGPTYKSEHRWVSVNLDIAAYTYLAPGSILSLEGHHAYLETHPNLLPNQQFSLGRRTYQWSRADDLWQMGVWNPRFMWDPLNPRVVGLTGLFYEYKNNNWSVLGFASPANIPERGYPVRQDGTTISGAPSPWWTPPLQSIPGKNKDTNLQYSIANPPLKQLLVHPSAAISMGYRQQDGVGPEARLSYGVLPVNQIDLVAKPNFYPSKNAVEATIYPRILMHQLLTAETGFFDENTGIWASITLESPFKNINAPGDLYNPVGPSTIGVLGAELFRKSPVNMGVSYLWVREKGNNFDQLSSNFTLRYSFSHASQLFGGWQMTPRLSSKVKWVHDWDWSENLGMFDLNYSTSMTSGITGETGAWNFGLGMDVMNTATGSGFIGTFDGNERIRGSVSYAF